jgi:hypothetical protein
MVSVWLIAEIKKYLCSSHHAPYMCFLFLTLLHQSSRVLDYLYIYPEKRRNKSIKLTINAKNYSNCRFPHSPVRAQHDAALWPSFYQRMARSRGPAIRRRAGPGWRPVARRRPYSDGDPHARSTRGSPGPARRSDSAARGDWRRVLRGDPLWRCPSGPRGCRTVASGGERLDPTRAGDLDVWPGRAWHRAQPRGRPGTVAEAGSSTGLGRL